MLISRSESSKPLEDTVSYIQSQIQKVYNTFNSEGADYVQHSDLIDSIFFQICLNKFNIYLELYFLEDNYIEGVTNVYYLGKYVFAFQGDLDTTISKTLEKVKS